MSDICIKKQPKRVKEIKEEHDHEYWINLKFAYCKCGHTWGDHDLSFWDIICISKFSGKCRECVCRKYIRLGKFTSREIEKVEICTNE